MGGLVGIAVLSTGNGFKRWLGDTRYLQAIENDRKLAIDPHRRAHRCCLKIRCVQAAMGSTNYRSYRRGDSDVKRSAGDDEELRVSECSTISGTLYPTSMRIL